MPKGKIIKPVKVTVRQQRVIEELTRMQYNSLINSVKGAIKDAGEGVQLNSLRSHRYGEPAYPAPEAYPPKMRRSITALRKKMKEMDALIEVENLVRTEVREKRKAVSSKLVAKLMRDRDAKIMAVAFINAAPEVKALLDDLPGPEDVVKDAKAIGLALDQKALPDSYGIGNFTPAMKRLINGGEKDDSDE